MKTATSMERCTAEVFELHVLMQIIFMNKGPKLLIFGSTKKKKESKKRKCGWGVRSRICFIAGKLENFTVLEKALSVRPSGERTR